MTKIKGIRIHGFKSFANKTDIPFSNEFNCILGPNGSGKSNIGDALCFVLGRLSAKSMRAEKAANLIFNGGKNKKPASAGTVEITFCNQNKLFPDEEKDITISRSITNKGSVYRLNGKKKTRSEVLDYLGLAKINPDGYNIILQGDITKFVEMSPVERRKVIEEISDVSVYEEKKHKAELELQKVEEKLNNAEIILKERKTYLRELKKDRDQALKFKGLKDKIDSSKATYLHHQIEERRVVKEKHDAEAAKHQEKIDKAEKEISELKEKVEEYKNEVSQINKEIEQKGEKEQVKVHKDIEDLKVTITRDKTRVSTLKDEINKIALRKDQFKEELKELEQRSSSASKQQKTLESELNRKKKQLEDTQKSIADFKKKHKIESSQEMDKEIEEKDKFIDTKQEEIQKLRAEQQELLREKDKIEYQLESLDERIAKVKQVEKENKEQVNTLQKHKSDFKNATLRLNKVLDEDSSLASQLGNARVKLNTAREEEAKANAKAMSVKASIAGNMAVQTILENKNQFKGVFGTVAELGQVKKKYATALETAAGGRMQHLVVDSDGTASECISYLKSNKLGSAAFIPLNKIKSQDITAEDKKLLKQNGVHDFALNLVSYDARYKKAFSYVFGNSLVVEDINTARKVGVGRIRMTTLDGNMAETSGVMRGGFMQKRGSVGFKEKDSLVELENIQKEVAEYEGVISNILHKREGIEKEITSLRQAKAELEGEIIKLEKSLHLDNADLEATAGLKKELQAQLKDIDDKMEKVQSSISSTNRDLAMLKSKKQMLRSQVNELRNPRLLAQLQAFEETKQKCREELVKLESELKNNTNQMDQMYAPEKEKIMSIMKQHEKEEDDFKVEIGKLDLSVGKNEKELVAKEKASKEFYSKYHSLFNKREKLGNEVSKAENAIEVCREKMRGSEREMNLISLKNAEVKAKLAGLEEEFAKYKDREDIQILKNVSVEQLKQEISKFEVMLGQMSAVNMKALEVYEQVETEYNKLMEKKDGLEKEKIDVHTLMNEIETKKKEQFMKTFNKTNDNFTRIFNNLFKKGKAHLEIENKDKPFDGGLNIKVKITGNRFMDLKSLSGGEKTLTALSFIFAVQEHQPASFYILDEIDAALDKHNAETLSQLIRAYSDRAQYIVISHNDSLIAEADTLFGVSMKDGISKVTSLKI